MGAIFQSLSALFQASGVGASITVPAPAGLVVGEFMVAICSVFGTTAATITVPAGWTKVREDSFVGFPTGAIATKKAILADIGANFLFSQNLGGSEAWTVGIHRFSDALALDASIPTIVGGSSQDISLGTVVTIADNCLILRTVQAVFATTEPTSIIDPGTGGDNDHTRRGFVGGPNDPGVANPFAVYYTDDIIKTPAGNDPQPIPKGTYVGATGAKTTIHYAWSVSPIVDFQSIEEAEARAREKQEDGTWVVAHSEQTNLGAPAVRAQRFMSPTDPGAGEWVELTDASAV
ncbi:MAG: hypothetical protein V3V96_04810 [Acidiferrobacterales bacterium]